MSFNVADNTDPIFVQNLIQAVRFNERRTILPSRNARRAKCVEAVMDWINGWEAECDVACCWHAPNGLRHEQHGYEAQWLQRQLSSYFNKLVKRVFSHMPVKRRPNIARFVTLEFSDGVGWHAHGVIATPPHMTRDEFSAVLEALWQEHVGKGRPTAFSKHMCWFKPAHEHYTRYALKSAINLHDDNEHNARGFIDVKNTRAP